MSAPTQAQLDEFARRLRALEAEFDELQRQALAAMTVAAPPVEPARTPELAPEAPVAAELFGRAAEFLAAGAIKAAVKELERQRVRSRELRSIPELLAVLELSREAAATGLRSAHRLVYAVEQNIRFLEHQDATAPQPWRAAPKPVTEAATSPQPVGTGGPRRIKLPEVEFSDLAGARGLAIAGGVVTLLGIVFFFVLAVNRGWIGPVGRVGLGAAAALAVFLGGHELRRRYGETYAALAAVGAGIAGGYATLLAAAALYDLLPDYAALAVAAGIGAVGLATALRWRSEIVAGLGLIGALLVPVAVIAQGRLSPLGTGFAAVVYAATVAVGLSLRWRILLVAGVAASLPQIAALVFEAEYHARSPWRILLLGAVFSVLYAATGIGYQLRLGTVGLGPLTTSLTLGGGAFAAFSVVWLFGTTTEQGFALLGIAAFYGLVAAFAFVPRQTRDLSALLAVAGLTLGAVALADLLSGEPLAYAWAAEAAGLAWLARRTRELRFQVGSAAYLALALGHVLAVDAPPDRLFVATAHPMAGAGTAVALAVAAWVFAFYARRWTERFVPSGGLYGLLAGLFGFVERRQEALRGAALWLGGTAATYAASLVTLALSPSFDWGYVALADLWNLVGLAVLLTGLRNESLQLRTGGLAWLGVTNAAVVAVAAVSLSPPSRGWAFGVAAAGLLIAGLAYQLMLREHRLLEPVALVATLASFALSCLAIFTLLKGTTGTVDPRGAALLGLGLVYAVIGGVLLRFDDDRDFSSLFSALALLLGAVANAMLLDGEYMVLGWALAGTAIAWVSGRAREERLLIGAAAYIVLAAGRTLIVQAPPTHLFVARPHPAAGIASCLIVAACSAAFAHLAAGKATLLRQARIGSWSLAGLLVVYLASISVLEVVEHLSHASLQTEFQRGHTAVSAFWGLLGLGLLYAGLKRWPILRVAGLALFAVSLGKIFLYDLPSLSSITRALSFLAVGAVLLLGGFLYQRLSSTRAGSGVEPVGAEAAGPGGRDQPLHEPPTD